MHLQGVMNTLVDSLSKHFHKDHKWDLQNSVAQDIFQSGVSPSWDLFASQANRKCLAICFQAAQGHSARGVPSWYNGQNYLYITFFPFPYLLHVWRKIYQNHATGILVTQWWPREFCMASHLCIQLLLFPDLLTQDGGGTNLPNLASLPLTAGFLDRQQT